LSKLTEIKVPDIGDIADAEIIEISVSVGDKIDSDDTIIVLETDKATMDIPASSSGVVKDILCAVGDKVAFDAVILTVDAGEANEAVEVVEETQVDSQGEEVPELITEIAEQPPVKTSTKKQEINIPDIGDDGAVDVIEVSVKVGDTVEKDDTLIVLETEKASMDIPAPFAGTLVEFSISVGDKVSSGDLMGILEGIDVSADQTVATVTKKASTPQATSLTPSSSTISTTTTPPAPAPAVAVEPAKKGVVHASPAIRRFARELGADLSIVKGTGPKGRIVKIDVQQFVKSELAKPKSTTSSSALPQMPVIDFNKFGETESVPLSKIQKISSTNLHRNWVAIPHVTQHDDADITEMEAFRKAMKAEALAEGIKLTPLAFMLKAVVASLKAYPRFNSSLSADGETLIMKKYFNIGVAVETPDGLVVPVVKDVDKKSIYELASDLSELSAKAREKKLGIDGMQGSCFTISSLGGIGGTSFTPIVNWPDVAILGVSKSSMKPVWNGNEFEPRLMLPLSLSYDHRVVDGAVAARFVTHLSRTLGDIRRLVL